MRVEWKGRAEFAEVAEALQTTTELVMAVRRNKRGEFLVLYTPDYPDDNTVWTARLSRDADDLLVHERAPMAHPGMWEKFVDAIEGGDE